MKKVLLALMLALIVPAQAMSMENLGIYVAPKAMLNIQQGKGSVYANSALIGDSSYTEARFGAAFALGYDFSIGFDVPLRTELEYAWYGNVDKGKTYMSFVDVLGTTVPFTEEYTGKTTIQSLMVNVYYDFYNSTRFVPYVSAGLGMSFVGFKVDSSWSLGGLAVNSGIPGKTKTNFAWNVGLGCAYELSDGFMVDLGYRYGQFGKGESKTVYNELELGSTASLQGKTNTIGIHQVMLGIRYTF